MTDALLQRVQVTEIDRWVPVAGFRAAHDIDRSGCGPLVHVVDRVVHVVATP